MAIFTLGQITQNRPGARESVTNGPSRSEPTRAIGPIVGEIVVNVQCWCHLLESKCWGKGKTDVAGRYRKTLKTGSAEGFDYMETLYSNSYRRSPWINLSTLVWITFHGRNIGAQHNLLTGGPWCFHFAIQFLKKKGGPFSFYFICLVVYIVHQGWCSTWRALFKKKERKIIMSPQSWEKTIPWLDEYLTGAILLGRQAAHGKKKKVTNVRTMQCPLPR